MKKEIMVSTSIDDEDSSEPIIDYLKRVFTWIPNHVNPDFVFVLSLSFILGIIINGVISIMNLLKLKQTIEADTPITVLITWIELNFLELLYITLLIVILAQFLIYSYIAMQRILDENTKLKVPLEEFFNFVNEPRVARFYMHMFLMLTGLIMLRELGERNFPVLDTLQFMIAWFVLLLLLPIPEAAKSGIDPFTEIDF